MRILHISYSDNKGGAAIAALRIVKVQREHGIDAQMFVILKNTDLPYVIAVSKLKQIYNKIINKISAIIIKKTNKSTNPVTHSINMFGCNLYKQINKMDCDVVHLHWINGEMLNIKEISKIKRPIVWTLHDSWAFCGAEHHPNGMDDYSYINSYLLQKYSGFNINRCVLNKKKRFWKNRNFNIVAPSVWETESAKKSSLFNKNRIITIPNCLDLNIFKPIDKNIAQNILNLDPNKRYILFGSFELLPVKGGDLLISALNMFIKTYKPDDIELLLFGSSFHSTFSDIDLPVHLLGKIYDEYTMSLIYNAANVMLIPSRMENLPQTATESISCGTPVVCFNIGGLVDIVDHKINGYIANRFDCSDFAKGINWILNEADLSVISKKAREKALISYDGEKCAESYLKIYNKIIND